MTVPRSRRVAPLLALLALLVGVPSSLAHASLAESNPVDGASISMPFVVVLRFDEELQPLTSSFEIRDVGGAVVGQGAIAEDDYTMVSELNNLPNGAYQLHWIAITADDNAKTQGDLTFNVVAGSPSAEPSITLPAPPSAMPATPAPTPSPKSVADFTPTPSAVLQTPAPTPGAPTTQASGAELVVPLVLGGGAVVALAWLLLRRRRA